MIIIRLKIERTKITQSRNEPNTRNNFLNRLKLYRHTPNSIGVVMEYKLVMIPCLLNIAFFLVHTYCFIGTFKKYLKCKYLVKLAMSCRLHIVQNNTIIVDWSIINVNVILDRYCVPLGKIRWICDHCLCYHLLRYNYDFSVKWQLIQNIFSELWITLRVWFYGVLILNASIY